MPIKVHKPSARFTNARGSVDVHDGANGSGTQDIDLKERRWCGTEIESLLKGRRTRRGSAIGHVHRCIYPKQCESKTTSKA